jgi:hypothetical protein
MRTITIPISPYSMLQEEYRPDVWKVMVCCMLLNQTTRLQVRRVLDKFFQAYPNAHKAAKARQSGMTAIIKSLGFGERRAKAIKRMSQEFLTKWDNKPKELHGLGVYAQQSYEIFFEKNYDLKNPTDHMLKHYLKWVRLYVKEEIHRKYGYPRISMSRKSIQQLTNTYNIKLKTVEDVPGIHGSN